LADSFTAKVQALVVDLLGSRISGINETTRRSVAGIIEDALGTDGEALTSSDIASRIRDLGTFDEARAEMIARTEVGFAFNTAALTSYNEYGVQQVQAIDGDYDPECAARNGQVFSVDEAMTIEDHPNGTLDWVPA
jgi:SPP1 gp7 family putative phage head morphogenesis protein